MRFRGKSIRRKIVALLLVPLLSLTALWAFATVITGQEAVQLFSFADVMRKAGFPAEDVILALEKERRQTVVYLADPRRSGALAELDARQRATDKAVADYRAGIDRGARNAMDSGTKDRFRAIETSLDSIEGLRRRVEDSTLTRYAAFQDYNELVDPYYDFLGSLSAVQDADMERQGRALAGLIRARESVSREDALLSGAFVAGSLDLQDLRSFSDRTAERKILYSLSLPALPTADRTLLDAYWRGPHARALAAAEDAVVLGGPGRTDQAIGQQQWQVTVTPSSTTSPGSASRPATATRAASSPSPSASSSRPPSPASWASPPSSARSSSRSASAAASSGTCAGCARRPTRSPAYGCPA
ncbi:hypothetical protein GCM10010359_61160 [Streptomyces morookaense]|nr:hypothetical protein GCM10010359_61160 [Streptomyces morookaense]